jgi:hypothetical protein
MIEPNLDSLDYSTCRRGEVASHILSILLIARVLEKVITAPHPQTLELPGKPLRINLMISNGK